MIIDFFQKELITMFQDPILLDASVEWFDIVEWQQSSNQVSLKRFDRINKRISDIDVYERFKLKRILNRDQPMIAVGTIEEMEGKQSDTKLFWISQGQSSCEIMEIKHTFGLMDESVDLFSFQQVNDEWISIFNPERIEESNETGRGRLFFASLRTGECLVCMDSDWSGEGVHFHSHWQGQDGREYLYVSMSNTLKISSASEWNEQIQVIELDKMIQAIRKDLDIAPCSVVDVCSRDEGYTVFRSNGNQIQFEKWKIHGPNDINAELIGRFSYIYCSDQNEIVQIDEFGFTQSVMHGFIAFDEHDAVYRNSELYEIAQLSVVTIHHHSKGEDCFSGPFIGEPVYLKHRNRLVIMEEASNKWF